MNTKAFFAALLTTGAATGLHAQGFIKFNNLPPATGVVYLFNEKPQGVMPVNQDINFQLLAGADPSSLQPVHRWLLSDGSAAGINITPGRFEDPSHAIFEIPGVQPGEAAYVVIFAWAGNFNTWDATGFHGVAEFFNPTGTADAAPGLTGMPSFIIGIPEPSAFALFLLSVSLLGWRWHRARRR